VQSLAVDAHLKLMPQLADRDHDVVGASARIRNEKITVIVGCKSIYLGRARKELDEASRLWSTVAVNDSSRDLLLRGPNYRQDKQ
jgi:hypothetical protein